VDGKYYS
jgi:hypothetical protein